MTTDQAAANPVARAVFQSDMVVQEIGHDDDVDQELRKAVQQATGKELADGDNDDVADAVLLWFRSDDGDLSDALTDAVAHMEGGGPILLLTPKTGRDGYIEPSEIGVASAHAGLSLSKTINACKDWNGSHLIAPKRG
ncbi:DUF3052 domain-containing protein [Streptomyces sp. NPDC056402]|uniref:DUF3052 domain-containing protein n=1 Tax=Streptomyces sp. NPDC056402 TaxID=3345810 RepID=UPI0035E33141